MKQKTEQVCQRTDGVIYGLKCSGHGTAATLMTHASHAQLNHRENCAIESSLQEINREQKLRTHLS